MSGRVVVEGYIVLPATSNLTQMTAASSLLIFPPSSSSSSSSSSLLPPPFSFQMHPSPPPPLIHSRKPQLLFLHVESQSFLSAGQSSRSMDANGDVLFRHFYVQLLHIKKKLRSNCRLFLRAVQNVLFSRTCFLVVAYFVRYPSCPGVTPSTFFLA